MAPDNASAVMDPMPSLPSQTNAGPFMGQDEDRATARTDLLPGAQPERVQTRPLATLRTTLALMLREMTARYGRSPGGYLWAVLEPLGAILLLTIAFALIARHPPLGNSFILFYATGYMPFILYQSVSQVVARALIYSRPLLAYPAVTWIDTVLARAMLNMLTSVMVSYILLSAILLLTETRSVLDFGAILMSYAMAMVMALGVGLMNCVLMGLFPVWKMAWAIISRPLFLASGILILYEDLPQFAREILWFNPLLHVTGEMRVGFYPMYSADYVSPVYVFGLGLVLMVLGLVLVGRYHRDILNDL